MHNKACLFTLIVIANDQKESFLVQKYIEILSQKYPCNIVLISIIPSTSSGVLQKKSFSINTHCLIEASPDQTDAIPFLVTPEISSDIPTFLFSMHCPSEIPLIEALEPYVERIFFIEPLSQHQKKLFFSLPFKEKCVDLNWAKIQPWRLLLSTVFSKKERFIHLQSTHQIRIQYSSNVSGCSGIDFQAQLLQSWIALCLSKNPLSIFIEPKHCDFLEAGSVISVEIFGENEIHYLFEYKQNDQHISVHVTTHDLCEIPYSFFVDSYQEEKALSNAILQHTLADHYLDCLEILCSSAWQKDLHTI